MICRSTPSRTAVVRLATLIGVVTLLATLGLSSAVSAHTEFEGSIPEDGQSVEGPVTDVVLRFTNPADVAGEGFVLLTPDGTTIEPAGIVTTDGTEFVATFDPALTDGTYGFRWEVQAGDAHPINGSFRFTVTGAPAPTTAPATTSPATTTPAADTTAPTTNASATAASTTTAPASAPATTASTTAAPASAPATTAPATGDPTSAAANQPTTSVAASTALEEFLDVSDADEAGRWLGRLGRLLSIGGTVFAAGVTAALVWVIRGRRDEFDNLLSWIRVAGVALIAGGLTEMAALLERPGTTFRDAATTRPGIAAMMTAVGGVLVVVGIGPGTGRTAGAPRTLSAAVATGTGTTADAVADPDTRSDAQRWLPDATAVIGLVGIALAVSAYWFDGHTISRGPWAAHAATNLVHVASASVWAGGVFAMGAVASLRRHRRGNTGLAPMVVRFSSIATVSLTALTVAGVVMAWMVIDSVDDVWTSDWGRVLLAKVTIVALAAALGAYNHFKLRPELEARPDDPDLAHHLRISLLAESILLAAVVAATAILVAAAT